mgnify:CR=1 FL=1
MGKIKHSIEIYKNVKLKLAVDKSWQSTFDYWVYKNIVRKQSLNCLLMIFSLFSFIYVDNFSSEYSLSFIKKMLIKIKYLNKVDYMTFWLNKFWWKFNIKQKSIAHFSRLIL